MTKMAKLLAKQRDFSPPNVQMQVLELLLLDAIDNCCLYFAIKLTCNKSNSFI